MEVEASRASPKTLPVGLSLLCCTLYNFAIEEPIHCELLQKMLRETEDHVMDHVTSAGSVRVP